MTTTKKKHQHRRRSPSSSRHNSSNRLNSNGNSRRRNHRGRDKPIESDSFPSDLFFVVDLVSIKSPSSPIDRIPYPFVSCRSNMSSSTPATNGYFLITLTNFPSLLQRTQQYQVNGCSSSMLIIFTLVCFSTNQVTWQQHRLIHTKPSST